MGEEKLKEMLSETDTGAFSASVPHTVLQSELIQA